MNWTDAQRDAIGAKGRNTLVSAAAGSGKTAVLAERCAHLVADARPPARVEDLVVVTFTEEAARQMRGRIAEALRQKAAGRPEDRHILRQLALLGGARISTIHAFCGVLLRQYFAQADVDPEFEILPAEEAELLRRETAEALLEAWLGDEGRRGFRALVERYGGTWGEAIIEKTLEIHAFLESIVDPDEWLARARRAYDARDGIPEELLERQAEALAEDLRALGAAARRVALRIRSRAPEGTFYADRIEACADRIEEVIAAVGGNGGDGPAPSRAARVRAAFAAIAEVTFPTARGAPRDESPEIAWAKRTYKAFREKVLKRRFPGRMAAFPPEEDAASLRGTAPFAGLLLDFVEAFGREYAARKREREQLDFADLERFALRLLTKRDGRGAPAPSAIAVELRKRYAHVLVDEFQDINPVQEAILRLVSREGDPGGNLFAVGDVKQSIYRFRLAEPTIFTTRSREYAAERGGRRIVLCENFRSRPAILEAVNRIFASLLDGSLDDVRYGEDARLLPGLGRPGGEEPIFRGPAVELHIIEREGREAGEEGAEREEEEGTAELERLEREAWLAAARIRELLESGIRIVEHKRDGEPETRPLRPGDVVILLRSLKHRADDYARILERMDIPASVQRSRGFFEAMEIRDCVALLEVLDNPRQDIPLAACLRGPFGGCPPSDLLRIRRFRPEGPFHEAVYAYARAEEGVDARRRDRVAHFLEKIEAWRELVRRRPLAEALWRIYEESGYLAYVAGLAGGAARRANLLALHDHAKAFGRFARQGLFRFLRFLEDLRAREVDPGPAPAAGEAEDRVRILSVHAAKGLEFPVVVLPDLGKKINLRDAQGDLILDRRMGIGLKAVDPDLGVKYPTLPHRLAAYRAERMTRAEELRILYVALTRAKEHLILIGTQEEGRLDDDLQDWTDHEGAIPADVIARARRWLDWILPACVAAGARPAGAIPPLDRPGPPIALRRIPPYVASSWSLPAAPRDGEEDPLDAFARLESMWPEEADHPEARRWIERLCWSYPHAAFTKVLAVRSVTELKRAHPPEPEPGVRVEAFRPELPPLPRPGFLAAEEGARGLTATARGTATHLFLQSLDLRGTCDRPDLERQLRRFVHEGRLTGAAARAIDLGAVAWFLSTDLGRCLREDPDRVAREVALVVLVDPSQIGEGPAAEDPRDRVLLRAVIDVVRRGAGGMEILDYKTDRVGPEEVSLRAGRYEGQMGHYARALTRVTGEPVAAAHLVFLAPRRIVPVAVGGPA